MMIISIKPICLIPSVLSMHVLYIYWIWLYLIPAPRFALLMWRFKVDLQLKSTSDLLLVLLFLKPWLHNLSFSSWTCAPAPPRVCSSPLLQLDLHLLCLYFGSIWVLSWFIWNWSSGFAQQRWCCALLSLVATVWMRAAQVSLACGCIWWCAAPWDAVMFAWQDNATMWLSCLWACGRVHLPSRIDMAENICLCFSINSNPAIWHYLLFCSLVCFAGLENMVKHWRHKLQI
jgi:hypothetical protein